MNRAIGDHLTGYSTVWRLVAVDPADDRFPAPGASAHFHYARIGTSAPQDATLRSANPLPPAARARANRGMAKRLNRVIRRDDHGVPRDSWRREVTRVAHRDRLHDLAVG